MAIGFFKIVVADFNFSHLYDEDSAAFLDIPSTALVVDQSNASCFSCTCKAELEAAAAIIPESDQITIHGITYHMNDFVYIHPEPSSNSKLLDIGQITKIQKLKVHVTLLGRYDDYVDYQRQNSGDQDLTYNEVCTLLLFQVLSS